MRYLVSPHISWRVEKIVEEKERELLGQGIVPEGIASTLVIDASTLYGLNLTAGLIFRLADGQHTLEDMVNELYAILEVDKDSLTQDVEAFLQQMIRKNWIQVLPDPTGE